MKGKSSGPRSKEGRGGETVCLTQIQIIDYVSFFWLHRILPHILPHIKLRGTECVFPTALDLIIGDILPHLKVRVPLAHCYHKLTLANERGGIQS